MTLTVGGGECWGVLVTGKETQKDVNKTKEPSNVSTFGSPGWVVEMGCWEGTGAGSFCLTHLNNFVLLQGLSQKGA